MRRRLRLAAALLPLVLIGCGVSQKQEFHVPPRAYRSIVSLSPGLTEIVFLKIGADRLRGRTAACDFPQAVEQAPVVMSGPNPDIEKIAAAKPDLIVLDPVLFNDQDLDSLRKTGAEVFPVKAGSVDEFCRSLAELGGKVKAETEISEYIDKIEKAKAAAAAVAPNPRPKVAILMPGDGAEHYIAGVGSFQADLVKLSGGEPVGPDATRFVPLNVELLVQQNPDIIIVAGEPASVEKDPRLQSIKAIRNEKLLAMKPDAILRAGSRIDKMIDALASRFGKR